MISEYDHVSLALKTGDFYRALDLLGYDSLTSSGFVRYGPPRIAAFRQRRRSQPGLPPTTGKIYGIPPVPAFQTRSRERKPPHPCPPTGIVQNAGVFVGYPRVVPIPLIPAFPVYPIGDPCTPFPNILIPGNSPNFLFPSTPPGGVFEKRFQNAVVSAHDTTDQVRHSNTTTTTTPTQKLWPYEGGPRTESKTADQNVAMPGERTRPESVNPLKQVFSEHVGSSTHFDDERLLKEIYSDTVIGVERERDGGAVTSAGSHASSGDSSKPAGVEKAVRGRCRDIRSCGENLLALPPAGEEEEHESQPATEDQQQLSVMFSTETFNGSSASSTQELSVTSAVGVGGHQSLTTLTVSEVALTTFVQD